MPDVVTVRLPDGSTKELAGRRDGAATWPQSIGPRLATAAVAATVDGAEVDLDTVLPDGAEVAVITVDSDAGRAVLRHSTAHVLAQAVLDLWPGAHYAIGPAIADGFYYDFELPGGATFSDDDLERIDGADARDHGRGPGASCARSTRSTRAWPSSPTNRSSARSSTGVGDDAALQDEASADIAPDAAVVTTYRNTDDIRRPVPGSARALDRDGSGTSPCCGWRAPTGEATRSGRSCSASTAPPGSPRRRWPTICTG